MSQRAAEQVTLQRLSALTSQALTAEIVKTIRDIIALNPLYKSALTLSFSLIHTQTSIHTNTISDYMNQLYGT